MDIIQILTVTIFIISSLILMFFILIQSGKGGSMGILGGASQTPFGTSTVDIVEKITWWGILIFFVLSIISAIFFSFLYKKIDLESPSSIPEETKENSDKPN